MPGMAHFIKKLCSNKPSNKIDGCFFKTGPTLPSFIVYFWSFQTNKTIFTANQCEKMSCPSSKWSQDSNSQPLEHELSPMTTRPGLPPKMDGCLAHAALSKSTFIVVSRVQSPDSEIVFLSIIERKVLKLKK